MRTQVIPLYSGSWLDAIRQVCIFVTVSSSGFGSFRADAIMSLSVVCFECEIIGV